MALTHAEAGVTLICVLSAADAQTDTRSRSALVAPTHILAMGCQFAIDVEALLTIKCYKQVTQDVVNASSMLVVIV